MSGGPSNHPNAAYPAWLQRATVPVTVVVGPPGNGAAAAARGWTGSRVDVSTRRFGDASPGLHVDIVPEAHLVIDLATIICDLAGVDRVSRAGDGWTVAAFGVRNALLAALATAVPGCARATLVSPSPAGWQRRFWADRLGATIELRDPGVEAALAGAPAEGVPERFVHQWYAEARADAAPRSLPGSDASAGGSAAKRGYGKGTSGRSHAVLRDEQLAREPHCRFCRVERGVRVPATVLDHIEPFKSAAGVLDWKRWGDPKNHRSLCKPCHDARGATRSRAEKPPGAGVDGRPLDPAHPWSRTTMISTESA